MLTCVMPVDAGFSTMTSSRKKRVFEGVKVMVKSPLALMVEVNSSKCLLGSSKAVVPKVAPLASRLRLHSSSPHAAALKRKVDSPSRVIVGVTTTPATFVVPNLAHWLAP